MDNLKILDNSDIMDSLMLNFRPSLFSAQRENYRREKKLYTQ